MADSFNLERKKSCPADSGADQGLGEIVRCDFVENQSRHVDDQDLRDQYNNERMALQIIYEEVKIELSFYIQIK